LGTHPAANPPHFGRPADVLVMGDGSLLVSNGIVLLSIVLNHLFFFIGDDDVVGPRGEIYRIYYDGK
jgi:glucose/arabinose dehydrogenase